MPALSLSRERAAWRAALQNFQNAEAELNAAATALDSCRADESTLDAVAWRTLAARIDAIRHTVATVHSCASTSTQWWCALSGMIPGLSAYHVAGVVNLFTPLTVGALETASAIMRVIAAQVNDFVRDFNQRRAA